MTTTFYIHDRNTTILTLNRGDSYSLPVGYLGTSKGRPFTTLLADAPEVDVYLRRFGIGGKGKKKPGKLKGSGTYRTAAVAAIKAATSKQANGIAVAIGKSIGSSIGKNIGMSKSAGKAGGAMMGKAHSFLGNKLKRLIGKGDYMLEGSQTAINSLIKGNPSAYSSFGGTHAEMVIEYREYIGDLSTGQVTPGGGSVVMQPDTNLFTQRYSVNPGDPTTFPWLSNIAKNYEEYKFDGLIFEFVSTTSPYNTNSAMGEVILTSQDNVTGPTLSTRQQLFNTEMCCTARLDKNIMYGVECKDQAQNWYYVGSPLVVDTPANLKNFVNFYVGSQVAASFPSYSVLGEVWVTYRVRFRGPIVSGASDSFVTVTTPTTLASQAYLPQLWLQPTSGGAGAAGTGNYSLLTGSTVAVVNSGLRVTGVDTALGDACLQLNYTKLRQFEVFDVIMTFDVAWNSDSTGTPSHAIKPVYMAINPSFLTPYAYGFNGYVATFATAQTATGLDGMAMLLCEATPTLTQSPLAPVYGAYSYSTSFTFQYLGASGTAQRPLLSYTTTSMTSAQPFYPCSILAGFVAGGSDVSDQVFPIASSNPADTSAWGASGMTLKYRSRGIFDKTDKPFPAGASTPTNFQTNAFYVAGQPAYDRIWQSPTII